MAHQSIYDKRVFSALPLHLCVWVCGTGIGVHNDHAVLLSVRFPSEKQNQNSRDPRAHDTVRKYEQTSASVLIASDLDGTDVL